MELIELKDISKNFAATRALHQVSLSVHPGEILAVVGENGAGKSTLMKILSGTYGQGTFEGNIFIHGKEVHFHNPRDAEKAGIAIIHQELSAFASLTVSENLFVGHWPSKAGLVNWSRLRDQAKQWLDLVGLQIDLDAPMGELSVGAQQMVEIAKALSRDTKILILDEPTSALTSQEVEILFTLLRKLRAAGKGLIYISHKMEEIYDLCDRITVLRDGQSVHTALSKDLAEPELLSKMVGRPVDRLFPLSPAREFGAEVLRLKNFQGVSRTGKLLFGPISLSLRAGEILGFAGLLGAGRSELLQAIVGDPRIKTSGELFLYGKKISLRNPRAALAQSLAFVPEDRKVDSILPGRSLDENLSASRLAFGNLARWLSLDQETKKSQASLRDLHVKSTGPDQCIEELSGGNQQKVILGRALQTEPKLVLLDEPTRGVDVGAKYEIYELVFSLARAGRAVMLVSSDLLELMALADRIVVLNQGAVRGELPRVDFSQTAIMKLAIAKSEQA